MIASKYIKKKSDWSQLLPGVRRKFTCKQIVKSMHADRIKYKDKDMWYDYIVNDTPDNPPGFK